MEGSEKIQRDKGRILRFLLNRWFIGGAILIILYTLIGFFLIPYLTRHYLERFAAEDLNRRLTVEEVRFNPYIFRMEVTGFSFMEGDGTPIMSFRNLVSDFELSSLYHWAWTFSEVILDSPSVRIEMRRDGSLNLARIIEDMGRDEKKKQGEEDQGGIPPRLLFHQISLKDGEIDLIDLRGENPADIKIRPLNIQLENINTLPERKGPYMIAASTPDGETFKWQGEISLNPVHSVGSLDVSGLRVASIWEFARDHLQSEPPAGKIDFKTDYRIDGRPGNENLTLENLNLQVSGLEVALRGESRPILKLNSVAAKDGRFDLSGSEVMFNEFRVSSGRLDTMVDESGVLNWTRLPASGSVSLEEEADESPQSPQPAWKAVVNLIELTDMAVAYTDRSRKHPVELGIDKADITLRGQVLSGAEGLDAVADGIAARLQGIALRMDEEEEPLLELNDMELAEGRVGLKDHSISVQGISLRGGGARASLNPGGEINWMMLADSEGHGASEETTRPVGDQAGNNDLPWSLVMRSIGLSDFDIALKDERGAAPVSLNLEDMDLKITDVTGEGKIPVKFDLKTAVKEGGHINVQGETVLSEKSAKAHLRVKDLAMKPLQPYLSSMARLELESGSLDVKGSVNYGVPETGADLVFEGDAGIRNFLLREQETGKPFAAWEAFTLSKMHLTLSPDGLRIDEMKAEKPSGKFIINEDRSVNVTQILVKNREDGKDEKATETAPSGKDSFPIKVNRVRVNGGSLEFADFSLRPQFGTLIHQLKGVITGISSSGEGTANLELDGLVDQYGMARIRGNMSIFDPKAYTDISMDFRNVEMTNLTPYSARFAGYRIASGKLSLDLQYKIKENGLLGENQILAEQLTLGERVESPDAVNLPLELAIALLKDSDGKIDIGLPVKGSLDDPEFSIGHLVWKAIVNLLTKIVTAPFRALANLLGVESENLDAVAFDPGGAEILPPEKEKLANLSKALQKRPKLRLEVQACFDPEVDGRALREDLLRRRLSETAGLTPTPDEAPTPVEFHDPNTQAVIETLFTEYHSPQALADLRQELVKPPAPEGEKAKGTRKSTETIPSPDVLVSFYQDLYARILEKITLSPDAMEQLARRRGEGVRMELLTGNVMDASRVIVLDPKAVEKSNKKTVSLKLSLSAS